MTIVIQFIFVIQSPFHVNKPRFQVIGPQWGVYLIFQLPRHLKMLVTTNVIGVIMSDLSIVGDISLLICGTWVETFLCRVLPLFTAAENVDDHTEHDSTNNQSNQNVDDFPVIVEVTWGVPTDSAKCLGVVSDRQRVERFPT